MSLAIVHAADLHLDSPLRGLSAYDGAPVERLRSASRHAFSRLVDIAVERQAQLMLLAGDVWDGDWPDIGTGLYFAREMGRLERAGIRVVLLRGNHDAESRITKSVPLPDNVLSLSARTPQSLAFADLGVVVHGQSFERPDVTENIALAYPDAVAGMVNIGLLHTALDGDPNGPHKPYAPCRLADLQAKRYDYWALGHVHEHAILAAGTAVDGGTIAFPGVLQGRHAREVGAKGALWVEIDDSGVSTERLVVDLVRWHVCDVDVSGAVQLDDVTTATKRALEALVAAADAPLDDRLLAVRLRLVGRTALHGHLAADRAGVRDAVVAQVNALAPDGIFLEKIERATEPERDAAQFAVRRDALAELEQFLAHAADDEDLRTGIGVHLADFWNQLPAEVRQAIEADEPRLALAVREQKPDELLADARATLLDRLAASAEA